MPQYGGMSLARLREELRKRHAKVSGRKKELVERYVAVGDKGVSFTPVAVTDTSTASSLFMLCYVHVVSSQKLVIYHDCHIHIR